jgi:mRNA-degrading endonuclease toxin of MazEF toxin-antitoxin module
MPPKTNAERAAEFRHKRQKLGLRLLQFHVRDPGDADYRLQCERAAEAVRVAVGPRTVSGVKEPLPDIRELRKTLRGKVLRLSPPSRRRDRDNLLLCLQSDLFHATVNVIVVPLLEPSRMIESELRAFVRVDSAAGHQPMVACLDQIDTIHEHEIGAIEGALTEADMDRIDHALLVVMGLTQRLPRRKISEETSS